MKRQTKFKRLVAAHRKELKQQGYNAATISMWESGKRIPSYEHARALASIFNVPVSEIPYHKIERNL